MRKLHYGDEGTIHGTQHLHVETRNGKVVSVWFRCIGLPFEQIEVGEPRSKDMEKMSLDVNKRIKLNAVDVEMEDK